MNLLNAVMLAAFACLITSGFCVHTGLGFAVAGGCLLLVAKGINDSQKVEHESR